MAKAKTVKVAVLLDTQIDGVSYRAGQVVELDAKISENAANGGLVDVHPEAVAYRIDQGEEVVVHVAAIEGDAVAEESAPAAAEVPAGSAA